MIDIHTHLLPGVDDGSPTVERSVEVLEKFVADGVTTVVCTPHLDASAARRAPFDDHRALLDTLATASPKRIRLLPGWEIMLDAPAVDLTDQRLCLGDSRALLVEFARHGLPPNSRDELFRLKMAGRTPVVAHPERYRDCSLELVEDWRAAGAVMQMDVAAVFGTGRRGDFARQMLEAGMIDIFASDTHGDRRALGSGRDWLAEFASPEHVELLTVTNAERVLADQEPLEVPPIVFRAGLVDRLRSLFVGRRTN